MDVVDVVDVKVDLVVDVVMEMDGMNAMVTVRFTQSAL